MQSLELNKRLVRIVRENPLHVLGAVWALVIVTSVFAVALFLPHASIKSHAQQIGASGDAATTNGEPPARTSPRAAAASYADTVERVAPAVVTVRSDIKVKAQNQPSAPFMNDPMFRQFFGDRAPQMQPQQPNTEHALGSGVIVESNGTILTNNHVVEGASKITIELPDRRTFAAKVVGTDKLSDLAVLKVEAKDLPVLPLGNSDDVRVGDVVLAIGYPLGLRQTVTSGIISAKGRSTGMSDGSFEDFLQTDAPINHGNSGGALVDLDGELIGINSQILSPSGGNIGIGFSIPSNMARSIMEQLVKNGKVTRGQLGVGIQNVTSDLAEQFGLKEVRGVIVNSVKPGSPADKAGIKQGDVVTAINNRQIADSNELRNQVASAAPGATIQLTIVRDNGKEQTLSATLTALEPEKTASNNRDDGDAPTAAPTAGKLGVELQPLTAQIASQLNLKDANGLVIASVEPNSPADDAGLQRGDVIEQINRQPVKSMQDAQNALANRDGKSTLLLVNRQNQTLFVTVQPKS